MALRSVTRCSFRVIPIARNVEVVPELGSWFKREDEERKEQDAA
jgi:hypothetical protein